MIQQFMYVHHVTSHNGQTLKRQKVRDEDVDPWISKALESHRRVVLIKDNNDRVNWTREEC